MPFRVILVSSRSLDEGQFVGGVLAGETRSCGLSGLEVEARSPQEVARSLVPWTGKALQELGLEPVPGGNLDLGELEDVDLVLCMDQVMAEELFRRGIPRVYSLADYSGFPDQDEDLGRVPRPGGMEEYVERLREACMSAARRLADELESDPARPGAAERR